MPNRIHGARAALVCLALVGTTPSAILVGRSCEGIPILFGGLWSAPAERSGDGALLCRSGSGSSQSGVASAAADLPPRSKTAVAAEARTSSQLRSLWEIPDQLIESVSGERAKAHVIELSRYYREDATPGFHEAAGYILEKARTLQLQDSHIETFPVDGKLRNFNLQSRYGWNPRRAELWLIDPPAKLADFQETSTHLATWSVSSNVETELVDVGAGTLPNDYEGKDLRGKLVFTSNTPSAIQAEAVGRRGAAGIVSWWSPPSRQALPDQVHWLDTANNREDPKTFAFVLSRRQGLALKERLARGVVRMRAVVEAELGPGNLEVVSACIRGREKPDEEIVLIAHICHFSPSSNDDASGCGALLEIARAWQELIGLGTLPPPRRTIRFLWVPENHGTAAYLFAHPEMATRGKAVIDLDMVGEDLDRCNAILRMMRTPESRPSFLNDVVQHFAEQVAAREIFAPSGTRSLFRYAINDYAGGSDHTWFNDAGVGVPAVLLMHWPDNFYHTNEDSPDKVDPSEIRRVSIITFGAARLLAEVAGERVVGLAERTAARSGGRMAQEFDRVLTFADTPPASNLGSTRLRTLLELEVRAILSAAELEAGQLSPVRRVADAFREQQGRILRDFSVRWTSGAQESGFPEKGWILSRRGRYLSSMWRNNFRDRLSAEDFSKASSLISAMPLGDFSGAEFFNLLDGKRTLGEIAAILETERNSEYLYNEYFGDGRMSPPKPFSGPAVDRSRLIDLARLAEKAGLIMIQR